MDFCIGGLPLPQCGVEIATVKDPLGRGFVGCHDLSEGYTDCLVNDENFC